MRQSAVGAGVVRRVLRSACAGQVFQTARSSAICVFVLSQRSRHHETKMHLAGFFLLAVGALVRNNTHLAVGKCCCCCGCWLAAVASLLQFLPCYRSEKGWIRHIREHCMPHAPRVLCFADEASAKCQFFYKTVWLFQPGFND